MSRAKPAKKTKPRATLSATLVPRFGGRPPCLGGAGAVARREPAAVFAAGSAVELWDLATSTVRARFDIGEEVRSVAIDPAGRRAAALGEGRVHLLEAGRDPVVVPEGRVRYVAFDGEGRLWTATTSTLTRRHADGTADGTERGTFDLQIGATRGDGVHGIASYDEVIVLLDGGERRLPVGADARAAVVGLCETKPWIAVQTVADGVVRVLDWETGATVFQREEGWFRGVIRALDVSPDGRKLAIIGPAVMVVDLATGEAIVDHSRNDGSSFVGGFAGDEAVVASFGALCRFDLRAGAAPREPSVDLLAWSSDGARVALAEGRDTVIAEVAPFAERARIAGERDVIDVAFVAGDAQVAVLRSASLSIHDAASGAAIASIEVSDATAFAASPDGKEILVAGAELLRVDVAEAEVLKRYVEHDDGYGCPAWSADGTVVAALQGERRVLAFDAGTGKTVGELKIPSSDTGEPKAVALVGDDLLAATSFAIHARPRSGGAAKKRGPREMEIIGRRFDREGRIAAALDEGTVILDAAGEIAAALPDFVAGDVVIAPNGASAAVLRDGGVDLWTLG
ncbi:High-affnity carbon uptake protein Hat/HatR [Minicystis rosea]|nr:High-affnity carbon uptake protein Hat/HatR [Minicystis rosea]